MTDDEAEWVRAGKSGERPKTLYEALADLGEAYREVGREFVRLLGLDRMVAWMDRKIGGRNDGD